MSDVPEVSLVERLRRANARLREVVAAKDAEIAALRSAKDTENAEWRTVVAGQGLRIAELERRLGMGSDDSGSPSSKESIQAKAARKAQRRARDKDVSSREPTGSRGPARDGDPHPGIQQCVQHVFRRCRAVAKLGPGGVQAWATKVRKVLLSTGFDGDHQAWRNIDGGTEEVPG